MEAIFFVFEYVFCINIFHHFSVCLNTSLFELLIHYRVKLYLNLTDEYVWSTLSTIRTRTRSTVID